MSERLPYEEQLSHQWDDDLPLPDVNLAWADMKRRLEEDDNKKPLAWWRRGCMFWGFLLLGLLGAGWWLLHPEKWFDGKKKNDTTIIIEKRDSPVTKTSNSDTIVLSKQQQDDESKEKISEQKIATDSSYSNQDNKTGKPESEKKVIKISGEQVVAKTKKKTTVKSNSGTAKFKDNVPGDNNLTEKKDDDRVNTNVVVNKNDSKRKDSTVSGVKNNFKPDSVIAVAKMDSVKKTRLEKDTIVAEQVSKTDSSKKKLHYFSMGIALHQQIPVAGQKLTPYNSLGRKGSLGDYIPSLYFRLNRKDKWFLQAEFRYGAPQYNKEFVYKQNSASVSGTNPVFVIVTSSTLKKTFYHQLPLTFNYYLARGWFLGAGIQWNKFNSAVTEEQVVRRNTITLQDSAVSKVIKKENKDSTYQFTKNYFLGVIETEYQWKKLSLGARYTYGLHPYIKFTLPGGTQQQRSTALQIFIRYQLRRSKER